MDQLSITILIMANDFFFGYGSLVNTRTRQSGPAFAAVAKGWRRAWVATAARRVAYLTAVPDPRSEIDGVIAPAPPDGWASLDSREAAYERITATDRITHTAPNTGTVVLYEIAAENRLPPSTEHPVLLSYLDVVIQGYLAQFGPEGAARFFATTHGWEAPVLNDRTNPLYPRAQRLTDAETAFVDAHLAALGAVFQKA